MPNDIDANMEALVEHVLDPARRRLGKPIIVNSGFRCPLHNGRVGGVANSQHLRGEAADVSLLAHTRSSVQELARVIIENGKFDQVIVYPTFVHVSWKRRGGNRREVIRK